MTNPPKFEGFDIPRENWFRLPNAWTDIMAGMDSLAEIKVVMYVLRHTWGFQEYAQWKCLTADEFANGRRREDGSRIDSGTGLSERSVWNGIQSAVDHGYLECQTDTTDRARIKKSYRLVMRTGDDVVGKVCDPDLQTLQGAVGKVCDAELQTLQGGVANFRDRSEKDTKKDNTVAPTRATDGLAFGGTTFGDHAAKALYEALIKTRKLTRRLSQKDFFKWRDEFNRFLGITTCSKEEVKEVVKWYCSHLGDADPFMIQAFSAKAFCEKFDSIRSKMGQSSTAVAVGVGEDDPRLRNLNHEGKQWYIGTKKFCDDDPRVKELKRRIPNLRELSQTRDVLPFDEFNLVARELGLPEVGEEYRPRKATPEQIAKLDRILREDEFDDDDAEWSMRRQ